MGDETLLAELRTEIRFSEETFGWVAAGPEPGATPQRFGPGAWFAEESNFLGEFSFTYRESIVEIAEPRVQEYFSGLGLDETGLIKMRITGTHRGSLVVTAAIVIVLTLGTAYKVLKELSELPAMADGLSRLCRDVLEPEIRDSIAEDVAGQLGEAAQRAAFPPPPSVPTDVSLSIDTRPLQSLQPMQALSHRVHLGVAVDGGSVGLENLGDEPIDNLLIGLFAGDQPRQSWSLDEAFRTSVPSLGGRQTIVLSAVDFEDHRGANPDPTKNGFVDIWVQDGMGIHLFQFVRP